MPASQAKPKATAPILLREDNDGVSVLTLNRPDARNALSAGLLAALSETLASIAVDTSVRAVVLAADGAAFCAGHDLKELTARRADHDGGKAFFERLWGDCGALMQAIMQLPQPVIASVQGAATAAGAELVASCDLAVASSEAQFCTPGVNIGLFCSTPMIPLSRNHARKHAMEMLLNGDMISAEDARRFGLVNWVFMRIGKRAFYQQCNMGLADAYRHGARVMVENMLKRDADEGIRAFLEKRPAIWEDR
jgi:enoyl-CoA hydratase/carnithine racemase